MNALYSLPGIDFHDITAGFNGTYSAVAGYDDLTGRGSPVANRLIPDLVNYQTGTHLVVTAQPPASVSPGKTFSVTIKAENKSGNVVTSYNGYVTLSLLNSPGGSTLGGTLTVKAVNGVATFKGLSLNKAGAGYELKATSGTLTPATTNAFNETTTPVPRMMPLANTIVRAMDEYDTGYDSSYYEYDNSYSGYDNSYSGYDSSYSGYNNSYSGYDSSYSNYNSYANNYQSFQIPPSPLQYGGVGTGLSLLATMYGAGAVMGGAMVAAPLMLGASEPLLYSLGYTGYQAWQSPWGQAAWGYFTPTNEAPSSFYQGLGSIGSYLPFETNAW